MPLDWAEVKQRYAGGASIPTVAGGKTLDITGVDDKGVHIRGGSLWTASLPRENLERAARLIEEGRMSRLPVTFVEEYHETIAPERGTAVAHVLKDFGYMRMSTSRTCWRSRSGWRARRCVPTSSG